MATKQSVATMMAKIFRLLSLLRAFLNGIAEPQYEQSITCGQISFPQSGQGLSIVGIEFSPGENETSALADSYPPLFPLAE